MMDEHGGGAAAAAAEGGSTSHRRQPVAPAAQAKNFPSLAQMTPVWTDARAAVDFLIAIGAVKNREGETCQGWRYKSKIDRHKVTCTGTGTLHLAERHGVIGYYPTGCTNKTADGHTLRCNRFDKRISIFKGTPFEGFKKPENEILQAVYCALLHVRNTNSPYVDTTVGKRKYPRSCPWITPTWRVRQDRNVQRRRDGESIHTGMGINWRGNDCVEGD